MKHSFLILCALTMTVSSKAQQLDTMMVVERDVHTKVQLTNKVNNRPYIIEDTIKPAEVHYSEYTHTLAPSYNANLLLSQTMTFGSKQLYPGYVRVGFGHANTDFAFRYKLGDKKVGILKLYANHEAEWGIRMDESSNIGVNYEKGFDKCIMYFGVEGGHRVYTHYGRYFTDSTQTYTVERLKEMDKTVVGGDIQNIWQVDAHVGLRSQRAERIRWQAEVGYGMFNMPQFATEHQVRTLLKLDMGEEAHHCGANLQMQNNIIQMQNNLLDGQTLYPRHAIRVEPYYAYQGTMGRSSKQMLNIHLGINIDMNIGRGKYNTTIDSLGGLAFAPSPNVYIEAELAPKLLSIYAQAQGQLGMGNLQAYVDGNPHRLMVEGVRSRHQAPYTPADAVVGLHIQPCTGLLVDIHGGYAFQKNQRSNIAVLDSGYYYYNDPTHTQISQGDFYYVYSDYGRGKAGADVKYHYQDIVSIHAWGDYYFWKNLGNETGESGQADVPNIRQDCIADSTVYDRANWEVGLRIDGRIDEHWTLYSDNYFAGKRLVATTEGEKWLKPTINLSLGCQYEMKVGARSEAYSENNLMVFLQLNNYIHRKNDILYGYQTQGVNFLMGAAYKF